MAKNFTAFLLKDFDVPLCLLDYPREDVCDQSTWGGADLSARLYSRASVGCRTVPPKCWTRPNPRIFSPGAACRFLRRELFAMPRRQMLRPESLAIRSSSRHWALRTRPKLGGVKLNLRSADEVSAAVMEMSGLSESYLIEKMVDGVVAELIVGVARDEGFGPYLLLGGGGALVEILKDSAALLLPTTREWGLDSLHQLKCVPLLNSFTEIEHSRGALGRSGQYAPAPPLAPGTGFLAAPAVPAALTRASAPQSICAAGGSSPAPSVRRTEPRWPSVETCAGTTRGRRVRSRDPRGSHSSIHPRRPSARSRPLRERSFSRYPVFSRAQE